MCNVYIGKSTPESIHKENTNPQRLDCIELRALSEPSDIGIVLTKCKS